MAEEKSKRRDALQIPFLVIRCQAGDETAFVALYRLFQNHTLRYLRGLLDPSAAEDVQQEVWLSVYHKIAALVNPRGFRTWLYQTTRNRAIDYLRRQKRETDLFKALAQERIGATVEDPEERITSRNARHLTKTMEKLSPTHREVLLLRYWESLSYAEIALVTGCSIGTVRSRIHHAKGHMKALLEDEADSS